MKRKYYFDNLRWFSILLLIPYHTAMCWNCWGEVNYIFFEENTVLSSIIWMMSPWYMPLLMVLAGASAKLSLSKRSTKAFLKERVCRLFIPLIFGILIAVEPVAYFADRYHNDYSGGFFEHYKIFFGRMTDLTGYDGGFTPGHLWFLLYLFVISIVSLLIIKIPKMDSLHKKTGLPIFLLMGVLPLLVNSLLNFGGKSVMSYLMFYLIGYLFISDDAFVADKIVKYRFVYLVIFAAAIAFNVYAGITGLSGFGITVVYYCASWFGILTIIGFAQKGFNYSNGFTRYLSKISFHFYIVHYIWLTLFQFYIAEYTENFLAILLAPMLLAYAATFISCALLKTGGKVLKNMFNNRTAKTNI